MRRDFPDAGSLARAAAAFIVEAGRRAAADRGRFDLVLSGGRAPEAAYRRLAAEYRADALWARTHFWWGDERCVPPSDTASNYRLARRALLKPLGVAAARVHRIEAERAPTVAAAGYECIFPARPDLVLLGVGADGHTASLFPGSPALREVDSRFVAVEAPVSAVPPVRRITITPRVLREAAGVLVLAARRAKRAALARVFDEEGNAAETPARLVRGADWFVCEADG